MTCEHDWRFDGDDPYIVCAKCRERRDALSGRPLEKTQKEIRDDS